MRVFAIFLLTTGLAAAAEPAGFSWLAQDGHLAWTVPLDAEPSGPGTELSTPTWFPPLPSIEVRLHDGGTFPLSSARGKVLLLDFWASWCSPCLHELPHLQALASAKAEAGLVVVTVNARESAQAARSAADALGLKLPIGFYDGPLERAFSVRALPTLILADREGRIRYRWDSYVPDFDGEVAARVGSLLGPDSEGAPRKVADVLAGSGALAVDWLRELAGPIGGLAVVQNGTTPRIVATVGDQLLSLRTDGKIEDRRPLPAGAAGAKLRRVADAPEARYDLLAFRPGRKEIVWLDAKGSLPRGVSISAPVQDVSVLPPVAPTSPWPRAALATSEGLSIIDGEGQEARWKEGPKEVSGVGASGAGTALRVVALDRSGTVTWLDPAGQPVGRQSVAEGVRGLLVAPQVEGFVGLVPSGTAAAAVGRFLDGERTQAALASSAGQLLLVDLATGEVRFRARWPGITELAAGDLNGDGRDELLVGAGRSLAVLTRR